VTTSPTDPATGTPEPDDDYLLESALEHEREQMPDMEHLPDAGVRAFHVGAGFNVTKMSEELSQYVDILLGRVDPPIDAGVLTLMELAEAFHARGKEMEMEIHEAERMGSVLPKSGAYRFRTGKLRSFLELASKTIELGSRRVTYAQYLMREREGR
jgi:hypothetical protein